MGKLVEKIKESLHRQLQEKEAAQRCVFSADSRPYESSLSELNKINPAELDKINKEWEEWCDKQARDADKIIDSEGIHNPKHYTAHQSGTECIQITEHMNFCVGNAVKYLWRAGLKTPDKIKDLKKAAWYINREIQRIKRIENE